MKDKLKFNQTAEVSILRGNMRNQNQFYVGGVFEIECYDRYGNLKWKDKAYNSVVNAGLDSILNTMFGNAFTSGSETVKDGWAVGLVNNGETFNAGDTHDSHAGWTEFTDYTDPSNGDSAVSRPVWGSPDSGSSPGDYPVSASTSQSLTNSSQILYDITSGGTVAGLFLVGGGITQPTPGATDANNKGSTNSTPLLFSTANFSSGDQTVINTDRLRVTYTLNAS